MKIMATYKNKRNEHKYIEVKRYSNGTYYVRQYMLFSNGVKNYTGCKRFSRVRKSTLLEILEDYEILFGKNTGIQP